MLVYKNYNSCEDLGAGTFVINTRFHIWRGPLWVSSRCKQLLHILLEYVSKLLIQSLTYSSRKTSQWQGRVGRIRIKHRKGDQHSSLTRLIHDLKTEMPLMKMNFPSHLWSGLLNPCRMKLALSWAVHHWYICLLSHGGWSLWKSVDLMFGAEVVV